MMAMFFCQIHTKCVEDLTYIIYTRLNIILTCTFTVL